MLDVSLIMNASMLPLRSAFAFLALTICSCSSPSNVNRNNWNIEVVPAIDEPGALALMVQYEHSEHRGNSKGGISSSVVSSPGEKRRTDSVGFGLNSARYSLESGLEVSWIDDYRVKAEYDARYRATGPNDRLYQEQTVKGSMEFYVDEVRHKRNVRLDRSPTNN